MAKLIGIVVALAVFSVWMSVVGNPHVVETAFSKPSSVKIAPGNLLETLGLTWRSRTLTLFAGTHQKRRTP